MFTHILLAADGSEFALRAAQAAATLAKKFDARLTIVNVYHPSTLFEPHGKPHDLIELGFIEKRQDEALDAAGRIAEAVGIVCHTRRENGHPVEKIVQAAEQAEADLIVLGSRGLGDIQSVLLGSVSDGVMHHAHCPVLIVRGAGEVAAEDWFQNILLAADGSDCALQAAGVAATLAGKFASRVTILNVYQPGPTVAPDGVPIYWNLDDRFVREIQDTAICSAGQVLDDQGVTYQRRKELGPPAAEVVRVAEEEKSDLIVLGSRGLSGVKAFLLGSVTDRVAHHAHCPVLIVK